MQFKVLIRNGILCCGLVLSYSSYAAKWTLTPSSQVGFNIDSMGISIVKGTFKRVQSDLVFDPKAVEKASTKFVMDANSLTLNKSSLKNMIMGEDLFNVAKYKTVSFQSTEFKPVGGDQYKILGNLTIRGVTKPVIFDAQLKTNSTHKNMMDFQSSTIIKRSDFGMKKATGGIGEKVNIQVKGQWKAQ